MERRQQKELELFFSFLIPIGIIDDTELAEAIFRRVYNYLPTEWLGVKVAGLNERMRFLKYHPGTSLFLSSSPFRFVFVLFHFSIFICIVLNHLILQRIFRRVLQTTQ